MVGLVCIVSKYDRNGGVWDAEDDNRCGLEGVMRGRQRKTAALLGNAHVSCQSMRFWMCWMIRDRHSNSDGGRTPCCLEA